MTGELRLPYIYWSEERMLYEILTSQRGLRKMNLTDLLGDLEERYPLSNARHARAQEKRTISEDYDLAMRKKYVKVNSGETEITDKGRQFIKDYKRREKEKHKASLENPI